MQKVKLLLSTWQELSSYRAHQLLHGIMVNMRHTGLWITVIIVIITI